MTVAVANPIVSYVAAGVGPYPVPFPFADASHVKVISRSSAGEDTSPAFTVGPLGVTLAVALVDGAVIIFRDTPDDQLLALSDLAAFPANAVEAALDRLTLQQQEQARELTGTLRATLGEVLAPLPGALARAGKFAGFGAAGEPTVFEGITPPSVAVTPLGALFIQQATLPLAQKILGVEPFSGVAALRAATWSLGRPAMVDLVSNWTVGDGPRSYRWDAASTASDNGGSIIKETATAIGRWIENSGNVFVTLEQFGGGIAKTAAQNNAAFTLARAAGGIIRLGSGEYSISSRLTLQSGTTILGDPSRTSAIKLTNTTDHVILVADGADNIYLDQFTVRGSYASGARNDFHGVGFENTDTGQTHSNIVLSNLSAENISGDGFYLSAMRGVTCLGVMKATNCRFGFAAFKDVFDLFAEAIEVYGCSRAGVLFDCDTATDTAPTVRPNARVRIGSLLAERCALETGGHAGVLISGTSQVHIDRITVRNHGSVPGNPTAAVGALGDAVVINSGNLSTANSAVQISVGFIEAYDVSGGGALWVNDAREVWIGGGRYSNIWLWPSQLFASAVRITSTGAGLTNNIHIGPMQSLRPSPPGGYFNGPHDHLQLGTNVTAVFQAFPQGSVANSRRYDPTNTAGNLTIAAVTAL